MTRTHWPHRLVGAASIIVDLLLDVPGVPVAGGDVLATAVSVDAGGGINTLAAAARLGLSAAYAGRHGTGPFGDRVRASLAHDHIDVLAPATSTGDTGTCITLVDPTGERTFITVTGVDGDVPVDHFDALTFSSDEYLYVSGYDLAYPGGRHAQLRLLGRLPESGGPVVVFDPGPLGPSLPADVLEAALRVADVVTANGAETLALCEGDLASVAARMRPGALVIARDGASAVRSWSDGEQLTVPGYPTEAVDTTGAGDVHTGALLAALSQSPDLVHALDIAARAAAISVGRRGGNSGPTAAELTEAHT